MSTNRLRAIAALCLVLWSCASQPHCEERNFCPAALPEHALSDPRALHDLVVGARTRQFPPECFSCEEGTACASCDRLFALAIQQLSRIKTEDAAAQAAALVVDDRLHWDGGPALLLSHAVASMDGRVLPFLRPHVHSSPLAASIVECIEQHRPCW